MSPRLWAVRARTMAGVHAGRPDGSHPFRFFLTFTDTSGPARLGTGRETRAMLDGYEVAGLLHAIPSALVADDGDRQALTRVICLLSRLARNSHD
jgi:hypothetical protein